MKRIWPFCPGPTLKRHDLRDRRLFSGSLDKKNEAQRASSGGPTLLYFYTSPFVHRKHMNGRLRRPAAAVRHATRSPRCRSPRCRSPRCLLAAARGVERPLLCLGAGAPHGDRKRPRRNAHLIGASSTHASNYRCSKRCLANDGDVTREEPACGRLRRRSSYHRRSVKRTFE